MGVPKALRGIYRISGNALEGSKAKIVRLYPVLQTTLAVFTGKFGHYCC
jgi:hypothetical protein